MASTLTRGPHQPLPALDLQRHHGVVALVQIEAGRALAHAEADAAGVDSVRAQPHLEAPPLPHPHRGRQLDARHHQAHRRVAAPEGREGLHRLGGGSLRSRPPTTASTRRTRARAMAAAEPSAARISSSRKRAIDDAGSSRPTAPGCPPQRVRAP